MVQLRVGLVPLRSGDNYIQILLQQEGEEWIFPSWEVSISDDASLSDSLIAEFENHTGLDLLVLSLEPVYIGERDGLTIQYFAGFTRREQELEAPEPGKRFLWYHHRNVQLKLKHTDLAPVFTNTIEWLEEDAYAAEFLALNLSKVR